MNIKITYNWLLDYLDTDATPQELQKYLSLAGPSIERVDKVGDDYVFDIEVTSNRVDMASVFGVAQEAQAILTQFGKRSKLKSNPLTEFSFKSLGALKDDKKLDIQIKDKGLVSRFAAIVLSDVQIKKSPEHISKRLVLCDIKSINNVVDISNYLMIALGQPIHMFDYDQVKDGRMVVRESKKGEKIMTLDKVEVTLPGGDIVIEDGSGKLIDLCGIMGGLSSSISEKTKNVILFVQTYDKKKIRKTSMSTGQRTVAATYFEKGLDEERVEPTLVYGVDLLKQYAGATPSSKLYDIYDSKKKECVITVDTDRVNLRIGASITVAAYENILTNLGFKVAKSGKSSLKVTVPTYRVDDVLVEEDIAEEIARIYGYHNLPSTLPPMTYVKRNEDVDKIFDIQSKIKHYLKAIGLHETYNYSMISHELLTNLGLSVEHHLKLSNTISDELTYMRTSLLPSLIKNLKENQGKEDVLKFFEIAKVYYPQKGDLPKEVYKVAIATNTDFLDLKGIIFALLRELNIVSGVTVRRGAIPVFSTHVQADTVLNGTTFGTLGQLNPTYQSAFGLKAPVYLASLDLLTLVQNTAITPVYKKINPYAVVKLDLTLKIDDFGSTVEKARGASSLLEDVELIDSYKDQKTLRLYFTSDKKNLTEKEAQVELEKIKKATGQE